MKIFPVAIPLVLLLASCSKPSIDSSSYFPLAQGLRWDYLVTSRVGDSIQLSDFSIHAGSEESINDAPHSVRITSDGTRYYIAENSSGIYRKAKRTLIENRPSIDDPPHWILKYPLRKGTHWSNPTYPFVLRRVYPYEERLTRGMNLKMTYQIASENDTVVVPAGRFDNCLRVEGEANLTLYADAKSGYEEILINTTEWYAPGVGLVKLLREEPLVNEVFAGGNLVYELKSLHR
ncbi:MAG: hypothetical protein KME56_16420 [Candidatus Thiodiazotropha sp. (ex Ctena orbiculata)]|nr:hypothetical protein [Candidatus Thiodiazotropha taylori]MBT2998200.1 hypothetical protein [Candidatus Thiodiazotropha taylori]MBT3002498.1 hypothetical protein [Candidatus Thiodiazotropha taylori]MBV2109181.1 hypothetical protein [Candidatus Thiodiazotropha taylori]MBV2112798.1 hypothetical protein [Candidatus Thiodiazotropha taylori]